MQTDSKLAVLIYSVALWFTCLAPAKADDSNLQLSMAWEAGRVSDHHQIISIRQSLGERVIGPVIEGSYRQRISEHPEGLLISRSQVRFEPWMKEGLETDSKPSAMQNVIQTITMLLLFSRPDHIITADGTLVRLHNTDAFKKSLLASFEALSGTKFDQLEQPFKALTTLFDDVEQYAEPIKKDLAVWQEWSDKTLALDKPVAGSTKIRIKQSGDKSKEPKVLDGQFSYHGSIPCSENQPNTLCADLRFSADPPEAGSAEQPTTYTMQLIAKPGTLIPYRHTVEMLTANGVETRTEHTITDID